MSTYENRDEASELVNYILDEIAEGKEEITLAFGETGWENSNNG